MADVGAWFFMLATVLQVLDPVVFIEFCGPLRIEIRRHLYCGAVCFGSMSARDCSVVVVSIMQVTSAVASLNGRNKLKKRHGARSSIANRWSQPFGCPVSRSTAHKGHEFK